MKESNTSSWRSEGIDPSLFEFKKVEQQKKETIENQPQGYDPKCAVSAEVARLMGTRFFVKGSDGKYYPKAESSNQC